MKIKSMLKNWFFNRFHLSADLPVEEFILSHKKIRALKGTIRKKQDQDDAWYYELVKHHDNIFDIGANIGLTALLAKHRDAQKKLLLVDPNIYALRNAMHNLMLNDWLHKVDATVALVSDTVSKKTKFYTVGAGAAGSIFKGHAETAAKLDSYFEIDTLTLDVIGENVSWKPDFIKIDVEGAESMVLAGGINIVKKHKPTIMVEMHSPPELPMIDNANRVLDWCKRVGYSAYYMRDQITITEASLIAVRGKCHLLLLPEGQAYPEYLKSISQRDPLPFE